MEAEKCKHRSPETEIKKGQHISPKTEFKKGMVPWNKGLKGAYKASDETRKKLSNARRGKKRGYYKGHEPEEKACLVCGSKFLVGGRGRPMRSVKFCSPECRCKAKYNNVYTPCNKLTPVEAAYIAGIVDGEGSIMLIMSGKRSLTLRVAVAQTKKSSCLLDWILKTTGVGSIITTNQREEKHDIPMHWQCNSLTAVSLLNQIIQYLVIKKTQAELSLDAMERLKIPSLKADMSWQKEYRLKMKELNKRGLRDYMAQEGG